MQTKRVPIVIPSTLLADLESRAAAIGATRAEFVESTLADAVAEYAAENPEPENVVPFC